MLAVGDPELPSAFLPETPTFPSVIRYSSRHPALQFLFIPALWSLCTPACACDPEPTHVILGFASLYAVLVTLCTPANIQSSLATMFPSALQSVTCSSIVFPCKFLPAYHYQHLCTCSLFLCAFVCFCAQLSLLPTALWIQYPRPAREFDLLSPASCLGESEGGSITSPPDSVLWLFTNRKVMPSCAFSTLSGPVATIKSWSPTLPLVGAHSQSVTGPHWKKSYHTGFPTCLVSDAWFAISKFPAEILRLIY